MRNVARILNARSAHPQKKTKPRQRLTGKSSAAPSPRSLLYPDRYLLLPLLAKLVCDKLILFTQAVHDSNSTALKPFDYYLKRLIHIH